MAQKVLLIEDDPFLGSLLNNRFKREGIDVVAVKNGNEAIKSMKAQAFDLALLDIILPGKSGFEVLEEIKSDPQISQVPVIIISNLGQESDIARGKELGAIDYVVKAKIPIDELVKKVKDYLK